MTHRVAIIQPNFVPWLGYFDIIDAVDTFVLLDSVQYTKSDWRNRNRIKTPAGLRWITVPVSAPRGTLIRDVASKDLEWRQRHLRQIEAAYREAAHFDTVMPVIRGWFESLESPMLVDIDHSLIENVCTFLGIQTPILRASDFSASDDRNERLLNLVNACGGTHYVSGPAARAYLDEARFRAEGIAVDWMAYEYDPPYQQPHPPFTWNVSVLDLLLCCGPDARRYVGSGSTRRPDEP